LAVGLKVVLCERFASSDSCVVDFAAMGGEPTGSLERLWALRASPLVRRVTGMIALSCLH
jgi:hypothetical protein